MKVKKNWLEWTVFSVSVVLVLATLGLLIREAIRSSDTPPDIVVTYGSPHRSSDGYNVPITVENVGDETAEEVRVEVLLMKNGAEAEAGEMTFAFVPKRSTRRGWVKFRTDPALADQLVARATGFEEP